ncbi:MAG: hypothetical protein ACXVYB_16015 [Arthrobacter sp.]
MTSSEFVAVRAALNGMPYSPAGYFFAVDGTTYPGAPAPPSPIFDDGNGYWCGFSSGMVGGLANVADGLWASSCIGYPAGVVPMGPSVVTGVVNLATAIEYAANLYYASHGTYDGLVIAGSGYSQGAMVWATYWTRYVLNPNGPHHYLAPHIWRIYQFGDPYRTPGIAHGNALAGLSESIVQDGVQTGGIGGTADITVEQSNLRAPDGKFIYNSCANAGDIYAACPTGLNTAALAGAGKTANLIFNEVQNPSLINTIKIAEALLVPIGMVEEIINGMVFGAQGTHAPHWNYWAQLDACIQDALMLGLSLPHQVGTGVGRVPTVIPTPVTPTPVPAPAPTPSGGFSLSSVLSILKKLPAIRKELVAGLATAGSIVGALETFSGLPAGVVAGVSAAGGAITSLVSLLTNNKVIEVIDEVGKL